MDPKHFRALRQNIEQLCDDIEICIKRKSVRDSAEKLDKANNLLIDLSKQAEGEIQLRAIRNVTIRVNMLLEKIDNMLSKRESGKKGDGNIALKCNWNDNDYKAPCSDEAYTFNISEGRAWCSSTASKCREYGRDVTLGNSPCYESIALKELYFGAGWDHTSEKHQPRHIHNVKKDRMAILTTRPPGTEEADRLIVGCLYINRVIDDPGEETKIFGDSKKSIKVPFRDIKIRFWDYYKNPEAEDVILWASGLFRYVTNGTVLNILKAISEQYTNTNRDIDKVIDVVEYYETLVEN